MNTREIKFRAWVKPGKMQYNVVPFQWDYCIDRMFFRCIKSNGDGVLGSGGTEAEWEIRGYSYADTVEKALMQYTGLKDKNNKEIYEGDIVRFWTRSTRNTKYGIKEAVNINNGLLMPFYDPTYTEDEQGDWFDDDKGFEVIGNIYETPQLIENKTEK